VKLVGKPYAGKPHVRFDEGVERRRSAIEVLPITALPFTLLYCLCGIFYLATKAQIHEFSRRQEFKMQDNSINPPESLAE
jgi:hypothetical protein